MALRPYPRPHSGRYPGCRGSDAPAAALAAGRCTTSAPSGNCGPYYYPLITNSHGYNTYVGGCGSPGQCGPQTVQANTPGDWQVTSNQAARNTAVLTYPDRQQVFTRSTDTDPPVASFHAVSRYLALAVGPRVWVRRRWDRAGGLRVGDLLDRRQAGDVHGQRLLAAVSAQDPRLPVSRAAALAQSR